MKNNFFRLLYFVLVFVVSEHTYGQNVYPTKKNVAVIDLETRGGLSPSEVATLTDRLRSTLVKTDVFNVVERGKMDQILKEQGFQQTGCTTTECAVEIGKLLNVHQMVTGAIGKIGALYTIDISMIDVGSARITQSLTRDYRGEIEGLVGLLQPIANQLAGIKVAEPPPEQTLAVTPPPQERRGIYKAQQPRITTKPKKDYGVRLNLEMALFEFWLSKNQPLLDYWNQNVLIGSRETIPSLLTVALGGDLAVRVWQRFSAGIFWDIYGPHRLKAVTGVQNSSLTFFTSQHSGLLFRYYFTYNETEKSTRSSVGIEAYIEMGLGTTKANGRFSSEYSNAPVYSGNGPYSHFALGMNVLGGGSGSPTFGLFIRFRSSKVTELKDEKGNILRDPNIIRNNLIVNFSSIELLGFRFGFAF